MVKLYYEFLYEKFNKNLIVTPIYHFTSIYSLYKILKNYKPSGGLFLYNTYSNHVSFSRNYDMKSTELRIDKRSCRISVDYNKLKNNYKINPFLDQNFPDKFEREERVFTGKYNIDMVRDYIDGVNIEPSLINIEILKDAPYEDELDDRLNTHHPEENVYLNDKLAIDKIYNEYKNKIYNLKLKIPIIFVDKYKPVL